MKTISTRELAAIKRIAQNSNANVVKKNKLEAKLKELTIEYNDLVKAIEADEAGIVMRFGYTSEHFVEKVVITTDKLDKDGNPVKVTKYLPKANVLKFNEEKKYYEVIEEPIVAQMPERGNDYDADTEFLAKGDDSDLTENETPAVEESEEFNL